MQVIRSQKLSLGVNMKNKLSQFFINYMKNKKCKTFNQGGVDLSNNDPNDNWSALNPFRDSTILSDKVIEFVNEKNLSGIKSSMDKYEYESRKQVIEEKQLNTTTTNDKKKNMIVTIKLMYNNINEDEEDLIVQDLNLEMKNNSNMLSNDANELWLDNIEYE